MISRFPETWLKFIVIVKVKAVRVLRFLPYEPHFKYVVVFSQRKFVDFIIEIWIYNGINRNHNYSKVKSKAGQRNPPQYK